MLIFWSVCKLNLISNVILDRTTHGLIKYYNYFCRCLIRSQNINSWQKIVNYIGHCRWEASAALLKWKCADFCSLVNILKRSLSTYSTSQIFSVVTLITEEIHFRTFHFFAHVIFCKRSQEACCWESQFNGIQKQRRKRSEADNSKAVELSFGHCSQKPEIFWGLQTD